MSFELIHLEDFVTAHYEVLSNDKNNLLNLNNHVNVVISILEGKKCDSTYFCFDLPEFFMPDRDRYLFILSLNNDGDIVYSGWINDYLVKKISIECDNFDHYLDVYNIFCEKNNIFA